MQPGDLGKLGRYAGPRAPAALFSQLLFWTDLFVLTNYVSGEAVGRYSAALTRRVSSPLSAKASRARSR